MRIIFAGTPVFASESLATLLATSQEIIAVYTQPDRPKGRGQAIQFSAVKTLAMKHNLPIYQPVNLKDPSEQKILQDLQPDLLVVAAYGLILPAAVLKIPRLGCVNIHASLLPRWRGAAPIQHAILAGDEITGITIMQMDEGLDTGDMLLKQSCTIQPEETSETLQKKLMILGAKTLIEALQKLAQGMLTREKQNLNEATYANKIFKQDAKLDWHESAIYLDRKVRAFNPNPVAFSQIQDQMIRVWTAKPLATSIDTQPGTIIKADEEGIDVTTQKGVLRLLELQLPGGKRLPVRDILNAKSVLFQVKNHFH